ncbi:Oidioi.mRNA.OKI2018_I69.chr1.g2340.t1.cds [Oikopleura dioica]|uniref:Oidioi.mRNA.OKI2018_I69.chr1.g2340.t1.cds n=1 Tax=Oikopleura dioica TaxID=34765 RepID=A0ABN7SSI5_OIKDI|nr:Oidioi.mRNA.OKI2018_I69.chr1.g2340.t1.cds [Oikopleura dioica]
MSLWCDRYRPKSFKELDYNVKQADQLQRMVKEGDFPHLLVWGTNGAGKKTRINCILRELYGSGVDKLRLERHEYTTPSNKKVEIHACASNYHIEICPADAGVHDRIVIQELVKTIAGGQTLNADKQKQFKVIVITEANRLTKDAQHGLRRTMEKYMSTCRMILLSESTSKLIPALRSRCLGIRVQAPSNEEVKQCLIQACENERFEMSNDQLDRIVKLADRNLRKALLLGEVCKVKGITNGNPPPYDWEEFLEKTGKMILANQSPSQILAVRTNLYELIVRLIPAHIIFQVDSLSPFVTPKNPQKLFLQLQRSCPDIQMKTKLAKAAAEFEHRCNLGSKPIYHLEAFVARFMADYKSFMDEFIDDMDEDEF